MKKIALFLFVVLLIICGCTKKENKTNSTAIIEPEKQDETIITIENANFSLTDRYTIENSVMIENYLKAFTELSPEILERNSEIEFIKCGLRTVSESHEIYQGIGWTKLIEIEIKIKEQTSLPADWNIAGKTLFYYLGSGRVPGVILQTRQEHLFSGLVNEEFDVVTDIAFIGIDEIAEPTFIKQVPQITPEQFRNKFQEHFSKFGGRTLSKWTASEILNISAITRLYFGYIKKDDSLRDVVVTISDIESLKEKDDFYIAVCALISMTEPYLTEYQVKQFTNTMLEYNKWTRFWVPSTHIYNVQPEDDSVTIRFRWDNEL